MGAFMNGASEGSQVTPHDFRMFPDESSQVGANCADSSRVWWGVFTRPVCEKELAEKLRASHISTFLPMAPTSRLGGDSERWLPLFPGYLFLFGNEAELLKALATGCVCRILPVADQDRLRTDLADLQRLLTSDVPLRLETDLGARSGELIRVTQGNWAGISGRTYDHGSESRFLVAIDFLDQGVSVPIDLVVPRQSAG